VARVKDWRKASIGTQVGKVDDVWVKRVDPQAGPVSRFLGQRSLAQNSRALDQLGDMATPHAYVDGVLYTKDVGPTMKQAGGARNPDFWRAWREGSRRMGTYLNDIRPRNMGANGKIFDPAHPVRDAYVATAIVMALLGAGAAGALLGDDDD